MNILYCGDKNISSGLVISVLSLIDNISEPICVYILTVAFEAGSRKYEPVRESLVKALDVRLKEKNPQSAAYLIDITEMFEKELPLANMDTRFTPCCMLRLFADKVELLPEKILYLDNDVICRRDFSEIYNLDMCAFELAGVRDYYGSRFFGTDYINSGVMLINLGKIRETGLFKKCRSLCRERKMFMPDQSAINKLCTSKKLLPRRFNEQRKQRKHTVFRHFTTSFRFFPWIHSVSVKPWQIERMHSVLKVYEYDGLLDEYRTFMEEIAQ